VDVGPTPPAARAPARCSRAPWPEPAGPWPHTTCAKNAAHDAQAKARRRQHAGRRPLPRRQYGPEAIVCSLRAASAASAGSADLLSVFMANSVIITVTHSATAR
jgi:hypothetical protein